MAGSGVRAYGMVLLCDLALWGLVWGGLVLLRWPSGGGLALGWLWALGAVRWALLHRLSLAALGGRDRPVLRRWVAALSLLGPAFESGKAALQQGTRSGPVPDPGAVAVSVVAASAACLFWELTFPEAKRRTRGGAEQQEAKALFMRVVHYSRPDALQLGAAFLFLILALICEMLIPYFTGRVVDLLGSQYQHSSFLSAVGLMGLFSLGSSMCAGLRGGMFMYSLSRLNKRIRHMLFHSLLQQEISFFEETKPGMLSSRLSSDTHKMGLSVVMNVNVLVRSVVKTLGMLGFMLVLSWQLTLLTFVEMPLLVLLQNSYNTSCQALTLQLQECKAEAEGVASSVLGAVRTVRSFGAERRETRRYEEVMAKMHSIQTSKGIQSAVHLLLRRLVMVGVRVIVLLYGRHLIGSGQLTSGGLLAFILYQKNMDRNMRNLVYICGEMLNSAGAAVKVFEYLDRKPRLKEAGKLEPSNLEGHLTFRDVTFSYPGARTHPP
ncbi:hypothetical protein AAFF_G00100630 [Aldrovandia affinis]|uniref:ABC transmembrane type-1 domain-containing protein n=1 Tax=Aldrovandia affinis TaxID=143900 RepID=A0AAD7RUT5_9TELE|nr:hypothetical protein AAFF_G00100630 [Aldrovandia affinis]